MQIFIVKFTQDSCFFVFCNNRLLFRNVFFVNLKKSHFPKKKNVLIWLVLKKFVILQKTLHGQYKKEI